MHKVMMGLLIGFLLAGCAVKKELIPIGGSKADGTVRMGYSKSVFENPIVDLEQAKQIAAKKCHTWGYDDAEAFGGQTSVCAEMGSHGCTLTNVTVEYQCTGGKN